MRVHALARRRRPAVRGESAAIVLRGATIVSYDATEARTLAMAHGRVAAECGSEARIDLRDHFVFPGLVNAHDHLQLNCIPPLEHAAPFANSYVWIDGFDAHRKRADVAAAVQVPSDVRHWHGGLKNILAGVTTVAHHDPWHAVLDDPDFPVGVLSEFGWSHSLGLGGRLPGEAPKYGPGVYSSFLTTPWSQPWFIHVAEGIDDVAAGELSRLDELGCLSGNTVIVHGVGLTPRDAKRIAERQASVVWCPSSNLGMFGRTLDPGPPFEAGCVALGTDSRLTGSRDLLEELRVAAANCELTNQELMRLVTADGADVLRMPSAGGLQVEQTADCVVLRADGDPHDALLNASRSTIRAVVRRGAPVIADLDFAEWFTMSGVETVRVTLDGQPKLIDRRVARPDAVALEPGLELVQ